MKKSMLALSLLLCIGCSPKEVENQEVKKELDYDLIESRKIKWIDIFEMNEDRYLVYFYSPYCGYCKQVKKDILNYYLLGKDEMYFVDTIEEEASYGRPAEDVMGVNDINCFYIAGTPTLVEITKWTVTNLYVGLDNIKLFLQNA